MSTNPKEELMAACIKGGMSEADCRKKMMDAFPTPQTDADLMREVQMLKAEVKDKTNKILQATDLVTRVNKQAKATEEAEKLRLIDTIRADSAYSADQLKDMDLKELQTINTTLKLNNNKTFAAVAADIAEQEHRKKTVLTVGAWDAQKKDWIGGL